MSAMELHPPPPAERHAPPPLDARVWMPHFMFSLQSFAHSYADTPDAVLRKKYYQLLTDLPLALPDARWQAWFAHLFATELPVQAFLADRDALDDLVYRVRCRVGEELDWPHVTFAQHQSAFYQRFRRAPVTVELSRTQHKLNVLLAIVIAVLIALLYNAPTAVAVRRPAGVAAGASAGAAVAALVAAVSDAPTLPPPAI